MIILQLLAHDLHRARSNVGNKILLMTEQCLPSICDGNPVIVSGATGKFLTVRKFQKDRQVRSGIFEYDSDKIDDIISDLMASAYNLSVEEKWSNIFYGNKSAQLAFKYIKDESVPGQPHMCLIPDSWLPKQISKFFGKNLNGHTHNKYCKVIPAKIPFPIFCSRPDMVGMYTQYAGGGSSIIIHNVKFGLAFCILDQVNTDK